MTSAVLRICLVLSAISIAAARLRSVEAGKNGKFGPTLRNGFVLCPKSRGFSVQCIPPRRVRSVKIVVNGRVQTENRKPFMAYGDTFRGVRKVNVKGKITVICYNKNKNYREEVTGYIGCGGKKKNNSTPKMTKRALKKKKSMTNTSPKRNMCVIIKGKDFVGSLTKGWTRTGMGVTFRKGDSFGGTVAKRRAPLLKYTFTVPKKSHYGITIDMTTTHPTEHNDIWFRCSGGFRGYLRSVKRTRVFRNGNLIKIYHNKGRRFTQAKTVDFQGYNIVSLIQYEPGRTYTCYVGGRSTKTGVNAILMWPCSGNGCVDKWNSPWKKWRKVCKA